MLIISHLSGLYGAERSLYTLLKGLRGRGNVNPIILLPAKGALYRQLKEDGFQVLISPYKFWFGQKNSISALPGRIWRGLCNLVAIGYSWAQIRRLSIDVVYTNSLTVPVGAFLGQILGKPHIWHARELIINNGVIGGTFDVGVRFSAAVVRKMSDKIICNSNSLGTQLAPFLNKGQFTVIHNGFDFHLSPFTCAAEKYEKAVVSASPINLTILGSLIPEKGQEQAIRAVSFLIRQNIPVRLNIAGDGAGEYTRSLKYLVDQLQIGSYVNFLGFVSEPHDLIARSAIILVCSGIETFGRVSVESLAAHTPVVGANAGATPEILENGAAGLLYKFGDPCDLAYKIQLLLEDRNLYEQISEYGHKSVVRRFSSSRYVSGVENIILAVAANA